MFARLAQERNRGGDMSDEEMIQTAQVLDALLPHVPGGTSMPNLRLGGFSTAFMKLLKRGKGGLTQAEQNQVLRRGRKGYTKKDGTKIKAVKGCKWDVRLLWADKTMMNNKDVYPLSFFTSKGISQINVQTSAQVNGRKRPYLIQVTKGGRTNESQFRRNPNAYK